MDKIGSRSIELDAKCYTLDAIKKCLYWYSDNFTFDLSNNDNTITITISNIDSKNSNEITDDLISELKSDLIDYEVRNIVNKETKMVKELLIAKAFSPTDRYEQEPPGEISDPVGFKP